MEIRLVSTEAGAQNSANRFEMLFYYHVRCPRYADTCVKNEPINRGATDRFEGSINN